MTTEDTTSRPSAGLRIWHWSNALLISGLLGTVILRKTLFSWKANSALMIEKAQEAGTKLDPELAKTLAKALRDEMWEWHPRIGIVLGFFILLRIILFFAGGMKDCPFRGALRALKSIGGKSGPARVEQIEKTGVKFSYAAFYLGIFSMAASGLMMEYAEKLGITKAWVEQIQEAHETIMWVIVAFFVMHVLGVLRAELGRHSGIISNMIHGKEPKKY